VMSGGTHSLNILSVLSLFPLRASEKCVPRTNTLLFYKDDQDDSCSIQAVVLLICITYAPMFQVGDSRASNVRRITPLSTI